MKRIYETDFHAAHFIFGHPKCGELHGHTYGVRVTIEYDRDIWYDFEDFRDIVEMVLQTRYDHKTLGLVEGKKEVYGDQEDKTMKFTLIVESRTAEQIALELQREIAFDLADGVDFTIHGITVELFETPRFGVKTVPHIVVTGR